MASEATERTENKISEPTSILTSRKFRFPGALLVWILLVALAVGTYYLSQSLTGEGRNSAAALLGNPVSYEISLYSGRAEPSSLTVRPGDEVSFVVRDDSRHNMAEERKGRSDARLESGELGAGESYSLVFEGRGSFSFYDRQNRDITVSIVIK